MKTLELVNGDLVLGGGSFQALSGAAKVKQDLGIALREPFGSDRFHTRWGSVLPEFIGRPQDKYLESLVQGEIHRVLQNYVLLQADAIKRDQNAGRKPRYSHNEIVADIVSVKVRSNYDSLTIRVHLTTLDGEEITITQAVEG